MRLLPKGFTSSFGGVASQFIKGVWSGMGPAPKLKTDKRRKKKGRAAPYVPRGL